MRFDSNRVIMDLALLLSNERRGRLAAERLLDLRQRELRAANQKLAKHARLLSDQVIAKRDEVRSMQDQTETLLVEFDSTRDSLARANDAAEQAETRLWTALQSVRDGFALFDPEKRLIAANKAYLSIFDGLECVAPGIAYDEIVEILLSEGIVDPQGAPEAFRQALLGRWSDEQPEPVVLRLWNGQFIKIMDRRTPDGGLVTLGINQTDQMRMWSAVEAIPDGFVLYDQEDRLIMCNSRYREIHAESAAALRVGETFETILRHGLARGQYPDAVGREEEWLEQRLTDHRRTERVVEEQLSDGRWLKVVEKATPDGGRVGLQVDISSIKTQQAALEVERERAEAANRAKSAFLANMSHEIRTPMNGVVGMADLLRSGALTPEQRLYVDTIKSSGEALLVILNDILDFSRIEARKMPLSSQPFDLESCLHEILRLLRPSVRQKDLTLLVDYAHDLPGRVIGDPGRVRQIFTNLVGNALKFTESGHVRISVESGGDDLVRVTVEDTGIGIPPDRLEDVFGEFTQVENDRNRKFDGTGLGLAICRHLVHLMHGEISVISAVGQGSRFTVTLPLPGDPETPSLPCADQAPCQAILLGSPGPTRDSLAALLALPGVDLTVNATAQGGAPRPDAAFVMAGSEAALGKTRPQNLIWVGDSPFHPQPDAGRFDRVLSLPLTRSEIRAILFPAEAGPDRALEPAKANLSSARPLRVLAAEDNKTNQLVLRKMLKNTEIDLTMVADGEKAVEAYRTAPPDLVFMDISMPGMDGREAARRIRRMETENGLPRIPIVAMTAHTMDSDHEEILAAGIDHRLTKPLNRQTLIDQIEKARAEREKRSPGPG